LEVLVPLAVGNQNRIAGVERAGDPLAVKAPDDGVGNDVALAAGAMRVEQRRGALADAAPDPDRRRARARGHVDTYGLLYDVKAQGTQLESQVTIRKKSSITNRKSRITHLVTWAL
jgi:hypothetical protein